jgi:hypothetical protein
MRLLRLSKRVLEYLGRLSAFVGSQVVSHVSCGTHSFPVIPPLLPTLAWVKPSDGKTTHVNTQYISFCVYRG